MHILRLLSEEIFDYSSSQMTHDKIAKLKTQFANEFSDIFTLCTQVLREATKPSLIKATLGTLLRFLSWLSVDYMFRSDVVDSLLDKVRHTCPLSSHFTPAHNLQLMACHLTVSRSPPIPQSYHQMPRRNVLAGCTANAHRSHHASILPCHHGPHAPCPSLD